MVSEWPSGLGLTYVLAVLKSQVVISTELRQRRTHAVIAELSEKRVDAA
jgi:hypothetical protein